MWANTQPDGGIILVGVEDNGKVTGCAKLGSARKNEIENLTPLCPDARWSVTEMRVQNDKDQVDFVLIYRVHYREDKVVETSGGKAFVREGSVKLEMSEALKREQAIAKGQIQYELEGTHLTYPDDFDLNEIQQFCVAFCERRGFKEDKTELDVLQLARLGKVTGQAFKPNLACCLLFAKDPREVVPGAMIRILRYQGVEEGLGKDLNITFDTYVEGPIQKMLEAAKDRIKTQIRSYQKLLGTRLERRDEYPEGAWFEAIVNAVAHRSYNFKTQNIFVKIFDDRITVESPGGFVPPTTAQSIYEAHNPRNPFLMQAMMHLRLTLNGFEGTRRMRKEMRAANLPDPKFVQIYSTSHQVHVTLKNKVSDPVETRNKEAEAFLASDTKFFRLEREERDILHYLFSNPHITIKVASQITRKSWPTAQKYIKNLLELSIIRPTDEGMANAPKKSYCLVRKS
jgi:ATP-dependent DNA helicase RecG